MANKSILMLVIRRILQLKSEGRSNREIGRICAISRHTVNAYVIRFLKSEKSFEQLLELDDTFLNAYCSGIASPSPRDSRLEDFEHRLPGLAQNLNKRNVTRMILWEQYRSEVPEGYSYTQFCELLSRYVQSKKTVMHLEHQPAEELYFDFAGDPLCYIELSTGEQIRCLVFIAVLPFSGYTYVEALVSARRGHLLQAMNNALEYFGGVPQSMKSDNMAQYVKKANRYEPVLEELVLQWSQHYNTTLLATRVAKPRDKAAVESAVNTVYHRIYAAMHNHSAHSLNELNHRVLIALGLLNKRRFQGRDYSRMDRFVQLEKEHLKPLPATSFTPKTTTEAVVQRNYHVILGEDKHYYSVPHKYVGRKLKVIYDANHVEIYLNLERVALYTRDYRSYQYTTLAEHMPEKHRHYAQQRGWTPEYLIERASNLGPNTTAVVTEILKQKIFHEQSYNSCLGILRLADKYSVPRLEAACQRALQAPRVNYTLVKDILARNLDKATSRDLFTPLPEHENIRGENAFE